MAIVDRSPSVRSYGVPPDAVLLEPIRVGPVRRAEVLSPVPDYAIPVEEGMWYSPPEMEEAVEALQVETGILLQRASELYRQSLQQRKISFDDIYKRIAAW